MINISFAGNLNYHFWEELLFNPQIELKKRDCFAAVSFKNTS
jgi:hypothetical protein